MGPVKDLLTAWSLAVSDAVTYTATLPVTRATVEEVAALLAQHRRKIGTRRGRRALGAFKQAIMFLRWMLDATKPARLAADNAIGCSTSHRYVDEALAVVAAQAPQLRTALEQAREAGYRHVAIDGTLIAADRSRAIGPTAGVDLWCSGKHHHHGGNVQVITAPDGFPIYTSPVRPGREHDTAAARAHPGLLDELTAWHHSGRAVLADLGYEGERSTMRLPVRGKRNGTRAIDTKTYNALQTAMRARAERGNALLKTTFTALRRVSVSPHRIGAMTAAAPVILHLEHHRTV